MNDSRDFEDAESARSGQSHVTSQPAFFPPFQNPGGMLAKRRGPEVFIREGPEELMLRAEEAKTQNSCIDVDHIVQDRWGPPLVDADWHAFCQAIYEGIEGKDWEKLYDHYKEMRAAGVKKPNENQKAKASLENEGGQG